MKRYLVDSDEMRQYDLNTSKHYKVPSVVLMERAALTAVEELKRNMDVKDKRVLVAAGCGNNGGDGIAMGRLLMLEGIFVEFVVLGEEAKRSDALKLQIEIVRSYGADIKGKMENDEYDIVIDAIFGVGLSRPVTGLYLETISDINRMDAYVCSLDIPSGINGSDGKVMGAAVNADLTVTFGFCKRGHFMYPGVTYCGKTVCKNVGITEESFLGRKPELYTYFEEDDVPVVRRRQDGNKGTFGKVLLIAGSETMAGAAMMAGKSIMRTGAGMLKTVTHSKNKESILSYIPETMLLLYDDSMDRASFEEQLVQALEWSDCVLAGPGVSENAIIVDLLKVVFQKAKVPVILDADALNLLAKNHEVQMAVSKRNYDQVPLILTPHMGELARICDCSVADIKENPLKYVKEATLKYKCVVVAKDARTFVKAYDIDEIFMNTLGNSGMATAGSGDVLAGIITGLIAQKMSCLQAAVSGVCLHALAGDMTAGRLSEAGVMATDMIDSLTEVLKNRNESNRKKDMKC